ncbi:MULTISPECIES: MFS transporter [unclassified Halanaerobium]|uniref:MFS transporter n=1 Tax=unclassified Halanaerobium TaxID=2641197 RepID=UPI000DF47CC9|nr:MULTISPECIES: MFS transporter [unclassified Halanaerobium]RCW40544.1 MFS transporter [Halanaerobium sp. MA284_MarDTE_T2]RCW78887.1 MFS transporter [Halanaerobium sp. DL-01]
MDIKKDTNIRKFGFYGLLKNLRFFEPFLYIFFLSLGFSYFQIGTLISIREITKNILEVPSGVFADNYGRKKSLQICFVLYIFSFILFYYGSVYSIIGLAMVLFGIGEAFRSGTHKAIIFLYLDQNNIAEKKTEVYGRTKSYSLIGSAISAVIGGFIVFVESNYRLVFLFSIIPYILDFILISTYPDYLDGKTLNDLNLKKFFHSGVESFKKLLLQLKDLRKGIINSGVYDGFFKILKDYLQPILKIEIISLPLLHGFAEEKRLSVLLGLSYAVIHLISSYASRSAFKLKNKFNESIRSLNLTYILTFIIIAFIGLIINSGFIYFIITLFILFYVIRNLRRPIMLDYIANIIKEKERATMLSIESQFRTIFIVFTAPMIGYIADLWGLRIMFFSASLTLIIFENLLKLSNINEN